jgi:hypothetical protein
MYKNKKWKQVYENVLQTQLIPLTCFGLPEDGHIIGRNM